MIHAKITVTTDSKKSVAPVDDPVSPARALNQKTCPIAQQNPRTFICSKRVFCAGFDVIDEAGQEVHSSSE